MTLKQIANIVASIGPLWCYDHFEREVEPPYIVYYYPEENDFFGDDKNYVNIRTLHIELFTRHKDFNLEAAIELALHDEELTYYKNTDYLDEEKLYQTTYELEVVIHGEE